MSHKKVLVICLSAVLLTALFCGLIIWKTWTDIEKEDTQRIEAENLEDDDSDTEDGWRSSETKENEDSKEEISEVEKEENEELDQNVTQGTVAEDSSYIKAPQATEDMLWILKNPEMYTYENMKSDLELLPSVFGDIVSVSSLGQTLDGREIYHLIIGDVNAGTGIFINGSIHGREYITSQLVMKQAVVFLQHLKAGDTYGDQSYEELLNDTVIHVVPMINPDGVSISQFGMDGILHEEVKDRVREIAALDGSQAEGYYLTRWKSNANGVDLNRNFDALWESYEGAGHPSSDHYKGTAIGCEPESSALIQLTNKEMFDRTISYHTQGSVIYWYFGQSGALYDETLNFANCISSLTGYPTDANYEYLDPAGYKDWGISKLGIVGLTVEIGTETSPVPPSQFGRIWEQNQYVWEETIQNAKGFE